MADTVDAVIKVKRGLESVRRTTSFYDGELLYSTDVKRLFVGDGTTLGGNPASSKTLFGPSVGTYAVSGDFFVVTGGTSNQLYVLTGADYSTISNYCLLADNTPAYQALTVVQTNSASWGTAGGVNGNQAYTTVNANSAFWATCYTTVRSNSATWATGGGGFSTTQFITNSVVWNTSAAWNNPFSSGIPLTGGTIQTFSQPLTASGDFLVITMNNKQRAIRLWDLT